MKNRYAVGTHFFKKKNLWLRQNWPHRTVATWTLTQTLPKVIEVNIRNFLTLQGDRKKGGWGYQNKTLPTPYWISNLRSRDEQWEEKISPVLQTCNSSTIPSLPPPNTTIRSLIATARWPCRGRGLGPVAFATRFHFRMGDAMMAASVLASPHTQLNYGGAVTAPSSCRCYHTQLPRVSWRIFSPNRVYDSDKKNFLFAQIQ